jgi:predicted ATP-binding protein involved in virulence
MLLKSLTLNSIRAFSREAKITFQPGMNLIVGINGVGKSTILDTVRIMLSKVLPEFTAANAKSIVLAFNSGHVTVGRQSLSATLIFHAVNIDFQYFVQQHRETYGHVSENDENLEDEIERLDRRRRIEERRLKDRSYTVENTQQLTSNPEKIPTSLKSAKSQPLVLYFSPHRSLTSMKAPKKGSGQSLAFVEAFAERELNPRAFAEWMIVQDALTAEDARKDIQQQALKQAVESFLPDCSNLRAIQEPEPTLVIDKAGKTVDIRQLSDGERSMLVLVMDLARRLSIASPNLKNPRE